MPLSYPTNREISSAMLVPNEKITGQVHFVYQLHPRGKGFRQTARHD